MSEKYWSELGEGHVLHCPLPVSYAGFTDGCWPTESRILYESSDTVLSRVNAAAAGGDLASVNVDPDLHRATAYLR